MTNSMLNSPPQLPAAGAWGSLFAVQEPVKYCHVSAAAAKKQLAYGVKRNLEMCTEALGCETGGIDAAADDVDEGVDRKRRAREEETTEGRVRRAWRREGVLPPPLTTLAPGATRMRMVHERRDGRLEVYAVRASGMEAERSGGLLRLRFLPCNRCNAAVCSPQEPQEAGKEEVHQEEQEEEYAGVAKYVRSRRCMEMVGGAPAARRGKTWEPEQAATFWVAIV